MLVYLADEKWTANRQLEQKRFQFGYEFISIHEIDYEDSLFTEDWALKS